ncbi:MAG: GyrI-like domain-containing protein [Desulfotomaculaceae bacterium]|nr:GyrI-like domain-containing protein [Desulfotomaculaceae bacterium]
MKFQIELSEQEAQPVLSIRTRAAMENLPQVIGQAYGEIMQYMAELGEQPADAPFTAYYNLDMQDLDLEIGFPVAKPFPARGEIKSGEVPQGKYVSCMYKGAYSQMEEPYNEMFKWIADNGYAQKGVYYEFYYNSPNEVPESDLLTKIVMPLK